MISLKGRQQQNGSNVRLGEQNVLPKKHARVMVAVLLERPTLLPNKDATDRQTSGPMAVAAATYYSAAAEVSMATVIAAQTFGGRSTTWRG
jgi:hypothetical protein